MDSEGKKCSPSFNSTKLWVISIKNRLNLKIIFDLSRILFVDVFIASCRYSWHCERRTKYLPESQLFGRRKSCFAVWGNAHLSKNRWLQYEVILILHSIYYRYHVLILLFDLFRYIYFEFPNANTVFKKIGRWRLITRSFMPSLEFILL